MHELHGSLLLETRGRSRRCVVIVALQAASSISTGNPPTIDSFLATMKVATVQQTVVAKTVQNIATAVAEAVSTGADLSQVAQQAEEWIKTVSGPSLVNALQTVEINQDSLQKVSQPPPPSPLPDVVSSPSPTPITSPEMSDVTSSDSKKSGMYIGIGVGLGVPILVAALFAIYVYYRRRSLVVAPA